ncbi:hypothetical protein [Shinella sp.]|uniref:hypothetical protein n=1 Tax=Shinella sp. TaxID=1870904 RepID=UPI0028ACD0EA|nr:hypothetical protein [Shinella sp.]
MPDWFPDWSGQRAVIVASGPSAVDQPVDLARDRCKVVAINNSWRLAPWADVLYASDAAWWAANDHGGFAGIKVSRSDVQEVRRVRLRGKPGDYHNDMVFDDPGTIGAGGSSGFQALNLAIQFGARDIALVGFDARVDLGVHWHGRHERTGNPTESTAAMWAHHLDRQVTALAAHGVRVVNCSPVSALTAYPKMELEDWLGSA